MVTENKTWMEAQSHCRRYHTDLASVRKKDENAQLQALTQNSRAWIGVYRDSWVWSDGGQPSFKNWASTAPTTRYSDACVVLNNGTWVNQGCHNKYKFVCYNGEFSEFSSNSGGLHTVQFLPNFNNVMYI